MDYVRIKYQSGSSVDKSLMEYLLENATAIRVALGKLDKQSSDTQAKVDDALRQAALKGYTETVGVLLEYKADVHARGPNWDGHRPDFALRSAAPNGHTDTVRVLLAHKADVHASAHDGNPDHALRWAAIEGHVDTVRVLLAHKANVHACGPWNRGTHESDHALRWAARHNHKEMVEMLILEGGASAALLPASFVHTVSDDAIGNVTFCLRLGARHLRKLPAATSFDMAPFLRYRDVYCTLLVGATDCCADLCILSLSYV